MPSNNKSATIGNAHKNMQQTSAMAIKSNWLDVACTADHQNNTAAQWAKEQIVGIAKQQQTCIKK